MKAFAILLFLPFFGFSQTFTQAEIQKYRSESQNVTIVRDNWGVPHIYGKTDADAVFGTLYAQCEENFEKVERNNLEMLGRLSEVDGAANVYQDLVMKMIYDSSAAISDYRNSPAWFKKLLDAAADGVNYFLYMHPRTRPKVLKHFEPWFALMRTNGSISATQTGGLTLQDIKELYKSADPSIASAQFEPSLNETDETGSNGFAVSPSRTQSNNAILYINPHVSFYYRTEMQMVSGDALNAYGGITWGTFFVFQGFNEHCGWMHTTSAADVADLYKEKIEKRGDSLVYLYDEKWLPVKQRKISVSYRQNEEMKKVDFTVYATGHGPVMGSRGGIWLSLKENNRSLSALLQSWLRTKAKGFEDFKKIMDMRSNSSDNTVFADDKGNIAYWHGNFIPRRDPRLNWSQPVDGTTSSTEWKGIHSLDEIVHVYNPSTGWIQNCNSTPFTVSSASSPKKEDFPSYMAPDAENYRAVNAERLLSESKNLTIDKMIKDIGYSHYLTAFEVLLPPLFAEYDQLETTDTVKILLSEPMSHLRSWNRNCSDTSIATTLAVEWANNGGGRTVTGKLNVLLRVMKDLQKKFGTWEIPWGIENRYQRLAQGEEFSDEKPSLPSGLVSSAFGALPSFVSDRFPGTNKRYGHSGNSFIACVEFGKKVRAKSIVTGGQSFDPSSKHFTDQADMFLHGDFKDVLFYREDVMKHVEREYHPGE